MKKRITKIFHDTATAPVRKWTYTFERDTFVECMFIPDGCRLSVSSQNYPHLHTALLLTSGSHKLPPNKKVVEINRIFKKGEIISGLLEAIVPNYIKQHEVTIAAWSNSGMYNDRHLEGYVISQSFKTLCTIGASQILKKIIFSYNVESVHGGLGVNKNIRVFAGTTPIGSEIYYGSVYQLDNEQPEYTEHILSSPIILANNTDYCVALDGVLGTVAPNFVYKLTPKSNYSLGVCTNNGVIDPNNNMFLQVFGTEEENHTVPVSYLFMLTD